MHCGAMTLVGWSHAACGDQSAEGKCRLGYVNGLTSPTLKGPWHILSWASKFTQKSVNSNLGGEMYAFSETGDRMPLLREFYGPFVDLPQRER